MKKTNLLITFLLFYLNTYSEELRLEDILKRAETDNSEVKIKELDIRINEKKRNKALKNLLLPPIDFYIEEDWKTVQNEGVGFKELEAYIPLFQGGKSVYNYKKSEKKLELAESNSKLSIYTWQEISIEEYFKALNFKKQYEITNLTISTLKKQRDRLYRLYSENKMIPKSEILKIEADIENNKTINLQNSQKEKTAKERLMQLLGYDLDKEITLNNFDSVDYLNRYKKSNLTTNPENTTLGKNQNLMLDIAEYNVKIAKANLYPTFYVKPTYKFKEKVGDKLIDKNEGRVEIGFHYKFEWGATLDAVNEKKYELEQAKIKYSNSIKTIDLNIRNKERMIESLSEQIKNQKKRIQLLTENLKIDSLRYDNGLITTFDYLNSVNQLRIGEEDYYKLQRMLVLSTIEYENLYR